MGFLERDIPRLIDSLLPFSDLEIASIFSHLSGSEDIAFDKYSDHQISTFLKIHRAIEENLNRKIPRHILNSEGIIRFPEAHFEYVRLGLGLYGISSSIKSQLQNAHSLYARIIHLKSIKSGQSVGYSRAAYASRDTVLGIINIGYADGYMRSLSRGKGRVYYKEKMVPIIGNICMDVAIIDLTDVENPGIGDQVELFGNNLPLEQVAEDAGTIPYEILTRLSSRIVRKHAFDY
jgi:alanine racemase